MAKKKAEEPQEQAVPIESSADDVQVTAQAPKGPIPGTVRIINRESNPRDITLHNGVNIRLAPFSRVGDGHISEPIPKKLLPDAIKKMVRRGWVQMREEV